MMNLLNVRCARMCVAIVTFCCCNLASAQNGKSTGRFNEVGVVASITPGNLTVTHDDGRQIDYSTGDLMFGENENVTVAGKLPTSFIDPGMVLKASIQMSPMGKVLQSVDQLTFVNDQSTALELERTDTDGVYSVIGKVIRLTTQGILLKVPKSPLARQGRVELSTTDQTKVLFEMRSFDRVNAGDTVESMIGVTYEGDVKVISSIAIELSPHRKRKTESLSPTEVLLEKYAYLSDDNQPEPQEVRLPNFMLVTDMSPLQVKVLGMKLESMHEVVERYFKRGPRDRIHFQIVADDVNWENGPTEGAGSGAGAGYRNRHYNQGGVAPMSMVTGDDHDVVLRSAYHAFCKMTFPHPGPAWYCDGMSVMANYWQMKEKKVTVAPEIVSYLKLNPPGSLASVIGAAGSGGGNGNNQEDSWKEKSASWALCYMMIHNANYSKDFRKWGIDVMMGHPDSFEIRFEDRMREIDFEYRQMLSRLEVGYREDLCEWNWRTSAKKLYGTDMVQTTVDARSGWQATKVEIVQGEQYEFVAQGQWQTDPELESCSADGHNGQGRLVGTIYQDYELSSPIRMGKRGKFTATRDGQLFLRCDDRWNQIEDNKGRLKVFVRKVQ